MVLHRFGREVEAAGDFRHRAVLEAAEAEHGLGMGRQLAQASQQRGRQIVGRQCVLGTAVCFGGVGALVVEVVGVGQAGAQRVDGAEAGRAQQVAFQVLDGQLGASLLQGGQHVVHHFFGQLGIPQLAVGRRV